MLKYNLKVFRALHRLANKKKSPSKNMPRSQLKSDKLYCFTILTLFDSFLVYIYIYIYCTTSTFPYDKQDPSVSELDFTSSLL